jgi:ubiquinone biosynthesis protein Coq4
METPKQSINLDYLKAIKSLMSLLKGSNAINTIYDLEDGIRKITTNQNMVDYLKTQPEVAEIIEERYIAPPPDIESLLNYPPESLGYAYASSIKQADFDPNFYRKIDIKDDFEYILLRMRQTHDIWHIVTGFQTDVISEIQLKTFEIAQTRRVMAAILVVGTLFKALLINPQQLDFLLPRLASAYKMGTDAKPLLGQKWEENWEKPLEQWRQELNLPAVLV